MSNRTYSNFISIEVSLFDFCFKFGVRDLPQAQQDEYDEVAQIYLSPQHAKAFLDLLKGNIEDYEKEFGVISMPTPSNDNNKE